MRTKQIFRRTTLLIWFLASLLCGLFYAKYTTPLSIIWLVASSILFVLLPRKDVVTLGAIIVIGFSIGWWRGGILQQQAAIYNDLYKEKITLVGRATEDGAYGTKSQLSFTVENAQTKYGNLPGKIKVSGFGAATVNRHDIVQVTGKLYPTRGGKQAGISYADIDVKAQASSPIETFRKNFAAGMENALPEPAASFGLGLLVGERSLLPVDVALVLTAVGLTHIVAVSGYNLTIIIHAVSRLKRWLSRFLTLVVSMLLIYGFILVTGFSPSIVRAAIVGFLGLLAWYFGRKIRPLLLLLFAAALTGFINPFYVWGDIGWYLSFLAFFGVLVMAPLIIKVIFKKPSDEVPLLGVVATESFAAQIITLPLILLIFGRLSLVGFIANIIIVPMVPIAMLLSFIAGLAGMITPVLSGWIALPARYLLNSMLWIADWFSRLPHATANVKISVASFIVLYLAIILLIIGLSRRSQSVIMVPTSTK
jgi:competence protein ComEC